MIGAGATVSARGITRVRTATQTRSEISVYIRNAEPSDIPLCVLRWQCCPAIVVPYRQFTLTVGAVFARRH